MVGSITPGGSGGDPGRASRLLPRRSGDHDDGELSGFVRGFRRTRAGQPIADAFAVAAGVPEIVAAGVNCCSPVDVPAAVTVAREVTGKPVIAYPNSGEGWNTRHRTWIGPSRYSVEQARDWVAAGARIIGECCRVRPADIAGVASAVAERNHKP